MKNLKYNNNGEPKPNWKPRAYTPEELAITFETYLDFKKKDYRYKNDVIKSGERAGEIVQIPISTPLSIENFCNHAGITRDTFYNYEKQSAYLDITARIRLRIEDDQLTGAMIDQYNPSIVARKLGLLENIRIEANEQPSVNIKIDGKKVNLSK